MEKHGFKIGDKVKTPTSDGVVWKVTDESIHVKHPYFKHGHDYLFSKYLLVTTHHSQKSIEELKRLNP